MSPKFHKERCLDLEVTGNENCRNWKKIETNEDIVCKIIRLDCISSLYKKRQHYGWRWENIQICHHCHNYCRECREVFARFLSLRAFYYSDTNTMQ